MELAESKEKKREKIKEKKRSEKEKKYERKRVKVWFREKMNLWFWGRVGLGFWLDQILESDEIIEISPNSPSFLSNCILIEILKKKSFNPPMIFLLHNTPRVCVCVWYVCVCI